MTTKKCTKCGADKPLTEYYKDCTRVDGLRLWCKTCKAAKSKAWYEANSERKAAKSKAWREANKEQIAAKDKAYYEANKERIAATAKAWREANLEREAARHKVYYEANSERKAAGVRAWQRANPERKAAHNRAYRAGKDERIPPWAIDTVNADFALHKQWADWYTEQLGIQHDVDHRIPLRGRWVSGLHCPKNFQVLDGPANCSKCNSWGPERDRQAWAYDRDHVRELEILEQWVLADDMAEAA